MSKSIGMLKFINTPEQALLWMQLIFLWIVVNYLISADPAGKKASRGQSAYERRSWKRKVYVRSFCFGVISFLLSGISASQIVGRLLISVVAALFALILPLIRLKLLIDSSKKEISFVAEWELIANSMFILATAFLISSMDIRIEAEHTLLQVAVSSNHLAAILAVASGLIFIVRGGTQVVRGILDKFEAVPKLKTEGTELPIAKTEQAGNPELEVAKQVDTKEYNRGRMIGNLERILLLLVILVGSYEALGFLVAGKGLIRAKEFEDRDFAEYFLLGTFTSTGLALVIGLIIGIVVKWLW